MRNGIIPRDELLDKATGLLAGLHKNYLTWCTGNHRDPIYKMDLRIVQGAVYDYIVNLSDDESLEESYLSKVIRCEKSDVHPGFFR